MTDDAGTPRAVIERGCPAVQVRTVERIGEGWDHVAFLVNDELVFRLPSADAEADAVAAEVRLLRAVAGRLPVVTPEPVHVADDGRFFGYRYLPGESVEQLLDDGRWTDDAERPLAELVVDVILAIEDAVPPEAASTMGVRRADGRRYPREEQRALDSGHVTPAMRAVHEDVVRTLPEQWAAAMRRPVATMHADLGLDHWLVGADGAPHALIDWSDSCVGPPELQLATLLWHIPELAGHVAGRYERRTGRSVDLELVLGLGWLNAMSDLGALLDDEADDDDIDWCVEFLERWTQPALRSTLLR